MSNEVLRAERHGVRIPAKAGDFSPFQKSIPALGPPSIIFSGNQGPFPGDVLAVREVDYSSPYSAEAKHQRSCTPTPPICLHGNDRDSFKFCPLR
jgi:hypothetical protein